jgi:hypothetical protein
MNLAKYLVILILAAPCAARHDKAGCATIPLIRSAWNQLPADQRFPCDPDHLVVILDLQDFLKTHENIAVNKQLREKARHAIAFTISSAWPIYVNLESHKPLVDAYMDSQRWIMFMIAGVLAHERVHAMGTASESAALHAELELDTIFWKLGKLPNSFDLLLLERQYADALARERK